MENSTWENSINPTDFVRKNITPYDGDESFLTAPTPKTQTLWKEVKDFLKQELESGGVLDIDTETISTITSHEPGYIDRENEVIIGLQTDAPLKRAIKPLGGIRVVEGACLENGRQLSERVKEIFTKYRKSHNDGVFSAYTEMMLKLRKTGILTGLPDAYARGRIIGDYRRVALYGVDRLIQAKEKDRKNLDGPMTDDLIRLREEVVEQIKALNDLKKMAASYGVDISKPAQNSHEAVQWTYFAYLASVKEQDGAAMSLGNVCAFFDIYIEKDLDKGMLTEEIAQELVDQFVIKLRIVRHLRPNAYNELFAGDPTWITEAIGGTWNSGQHKVTKTAYRFLHTLYNLGPAPEPNITILWSKDLPENFKKFCAKVSIETSSIQYENDDLMREISHKDDYGIACCVSRLTAGQQMQFFGARCNIAKTLLLALNEGKDEKTGIQIIPDMPKVEGEYLDYATVRPLFDKAVAFLMQEYAKTMNVIHYMHDKYYYENIQMALLDTHVDRLMAFGIAGLSVVTDSLSAIKNAKVKVIRDENGLTKDFQIEGDFPKYGNDKDEVDNIAKELVHQCHEELSKHHIYRGARPTLSVLTITSNVVYGHKTGATPDGRKDGEPFAPGANPMHGRDTSGAIASLNSVAKIDYKDAEDGISNTFSITPQTLGATPDDRISNLAGLLDGYFAKHAHHLNVNVMNRETLIDAMNHPENYPQLTIRVSGYAVNFVKLSREQQQEVLARTFFEKM
jgi:formate C-acetyltransferase